MRRRVVVGLMGLWLVFSFFSPWYVSLTGWPVVMVFVKWALPFGVLGVVLALLGDIPDWALWFYVVLSILMVV